MNDLEIFRFDKDNLPPVLLREQATRFFVDNYEPIVEQLSPPGMKDEDVGDFADMEARFNEGKVLYLALELRKRIVGVLRGETLRDVFSNGNGGFYPITVNNLEWFMVNPKGNSIGGKMLKAFDFDTARLAQAEADSGRIVLQTTVAFPENPSFPVLDHWGFKPLPDEIKMTTNRGVVLARTFSNRKK